MSKFVVKNLEVVIENCKILDDISFEIASGELMAILAPNGSGKTTLMRAILGAIKMQKGEIYCNQISLLGLGDLERSKIIAFMPQDFQCAFDYSVLDFVLLGGVNQTALLNTPAKKLLDKAREVLGDLGILSLQTKGVFALSGGQKQMVLLARALLQESKVLLLDEPTAWLDVKNQFLFFKVLKEQIKKRKLCVLMNIHDPNLVSLYADKALLLKNGRKIFEGGVKEVINSNNLSELYDLPIKVFEIENRILISH